MTGASKGRKKVGARKKVMRKSGKSPEIRCLLIPTDGEVLVLPMSTMAEVIDITQLQPMDDTPPWLLGQIEWESRQVPVFSFSALINGRDVGTLSARSKIMVLKTLSESARVPYLGLLLAGLPRPVTVKEDTLITTGDEKKSMGVYSRIEIEEQDGQPKGHTKGSGWKPLDGSIPASAQATVGLPQSSSVDHQAVEQKYGVFRKNPDPLSIEKWTYFGIVAGSYLLVFTVILVSVLITFMDFARYILMLSPALLAIAVGTRLLYAVLFGSLIWLKWLWFSLNGLGLIVLVIMAFSFGAEMSAGFWAGHYFTSSSSPGMVGVLFWVFILTQVGWSSWVLSIIWRDIDNHQRGFTSESC